MMNGSFVLFEADSKEQVKDFLREDPYVVNAVWKEWTLKEFRMATISKALGGGKSRLEGPASPQP